MANSPDSTTPLMLQGPSKADKGTRSAIEGEMRDA